MPQLTTIERLDTQFAGLADQVRRWFDQGVSAHSVRGLLQKQYGVSVSDTLISNFRTCRWARERRARQERLTTVAAKTEFDLLLEIKRNSAELSTEVSK